MYYYSRPWGWFARSSVRPLVLEGDRDCCVFYTLLLRRCLAQPRELYLLFTTTIYFGVFQCYVPAINDWLVDFHNFISYNGVALNNTKDGVCQHHVALGAQEDETTTHRITTRKIFFCARIHTPTHSVATDVCLARNSS